VVHESLSAVFLSCISSGVYPNFCLFELTFILTWFFYSVNEIQICIYVFFLLQILLYFYLLAYCCPRWLEWLVGRTTSWQCQAQLCTVIPLSRKRDTKCWVRSLRGLSHEIEFGKKKFVLLDNEYYGRL
jgi:hypothetical protein